MEIKDLKQHVKELMAAMGRTGTKRLVIKHDDFELELERGESGGENYRSLESPLHDRPPIMHDGPGKPLPPSTAPIQHDHPSFHGHHEKPRATTEEGAIFITSPMVGTYYSAASPEAPSFVKTGENVEKETIVCIIEAMKVMNEIKAGVAGTIVEVLVSNGDPVEFGTKLYRLR